MKKDMKGLPSLIVAVDDSGEEKAFAKINQIKDVEGNWGSKFNLDLLVQDLDIIGRYHKLELSRLLMADVKMHNGKRTMRVFAEELVKRGAKIINMHAEVGRLAEDAIKVAHDNGAIALAVTVTTHQNDDYCKQVYNKSVAETVEVLTELAMKHEFDGVILPGTTLYKVKDIECVKFCPATRPAWYKDPKTNDQEQIMTPSECIEKGADIVSCGSPIFKSPVPADALMLILKEIVEAKAKIAAAVKT